MKTIIYKPKVYLSGGFKSNWQSKVIGNLGDSFTYFNPLVHDLDDSHKYWAWDIHFVREADIIFAYMEETNPSGYGLALEIGLGFALNKTIILVDERSQVDIDFGRYFKIVQNSSSICLNNLHDGIEYLKKFSFRCGSIS